MTAAPRTVRDFLRLAEPYLARHGVASARLDAEVLLAQVLGVSRLELYTRLDEPLVTAEIDAYRQALRRRARREPVAYITGVREFYGLALRVGPGVLVPRPPTEFLVEQGLQALAGAGSGLAVDVGTGCGAVALALASRHPAARVVGVDRSSAALRYAVDNGRLLGLAGRVRWVLADGLDALAGASVDLVVSNPPYIPSGQWSTLAPEITGYEPREALDGGPDGLDVARRILTSAARVLRPGGCLLMELGGREQACRLAEVARAGKAPGELEVADPLVDEVTGTVLLVARRPSR